VIKGGNELDLEPKLLADQIVAAQKFLTQCNIASAPQKTVSFSNFRD
jgi:hypothetical protein